MAKKSSWQEEGVRLGGKVFSDQEAKEIVSEMKKRVSDPDVIDEVEEVLEGRREKFSPRSNSILKLILMALVMRRRK